MIPSTLDISTLRQAYLNGGTTPERVISVIHEQARQYRFHNIWIHLLGMDELAPYLSALAERDPTQLPLYGIPFAIKDNIDLADIPTSAGCPDFAYIPERHATVVDLLIKAGAIPVGKTNMDQFATGLVGTRSPYGVCRNAFDPDYISGGSSSGSAVAVALGLASFALGTDTAGSGRVPAMLNNLYGLKPSRGLLSCSGIVAACRSLDCPSIFALSAADLATVFGIVAQTDSKDPWSRPNPFSNQSRQFGPPLSPPRIAIPTEANLDFFGNTDTQQLFQDAVTEWSFQGAELVEVNISPMLAAAKLLYEGGWVSERYLAIRDFFEQSAAAIHPVVRQIIATGREPSACDVFSDEYTLQGYRQSCHALLADVDFLLTPTAGTTYTIDEVLSEPLRLNANLGYYTNYLNLLDLSGVAVPAGFMGNGIPFGTTLVAPALRDQQLLGHAHQWQIWSDSCTGARKQKPLLPVLAGIEHRPFVSVAVCGAHLSGMPLNWQLTERGATLVTATRTSAHYRLFALAGRGVPRPGLMRSEDNGAAIDIEIWRLPRSEFGDFVAAIPAPLGIGKVETDSGEWVCGFICEPFALEKAHDITATGSWRNYIRSLPDSGALEAV